MNSRHTLTQARSKAWQPAPSTMERTCTAACWRLQLAGAGRLELLLLLLLPLLPPLLLLLLLLLLLPLPLPPPPSSPFIHFSPPSLSLVPAAIASPAGAR